MRLQFSPSQIETGYNDCSMKTRNLEIAPLCLIFAVALMAQQPTQQGSQPPSATPQPPAAGQQTPPAAPAAPAKAPTQSPAQQPPKQNSGTSQQPPPNPAPPAHPPASQSQAPPPITPDPEAELEKAIQDANNDSAAIVRNLEDYMKRFPDSPRKPEIYRAIVESAMQVRDSATALDYAERLIAIDPNDAEMMMLASSMLETKGDEESLKRAVDYSSRVLTQIQNANAADRSPQMSAEEWEAGRKRAEMSVYILRGHLEMDLKDYDDAQKDFTASAQLIPNPEAALDLGEIAELQHRPDEAIQHCGSVRHAGPGRRKRRSG